MRTTSQFAVGLLTLLTLHVVAVPAADGQADPPLQKGQGLVPVSGARAALANVMPGIDWSRYRSVEIRTLQIPDTIRDATPGGASRKFRESYVLRDQDVAKLQKTYADSMREQLSDAGFAIVDSPNSDTLILASQIIGLRLAAPIESSRLSYSGGGRTYARGAGSMAIAGVLADGASGRVIAEMADQHNSINVWGINNSVSNLAEARRGFNKWARALRDRLIQLRAGSGGLAGPKSN